MPRRSKTAEVAPPKAEQPSAIQAVFDPDGDILVRAVAPSGNVYEIVPRKAFEIAGEDVDWFFFEWDWQWLQRLCRAEDYQPRKPQFDNGAANVKAQVEEPVRPQFDNGAANIEAASAVAPERPQFDNGAATIAAASVDEPVASPPEEEPVTEPEDPLSALLVTEPEESAPDPVEAGESSASEEIDD